MSTNNALPNRRPVRADTLDLKQKLAVALGVHGPKYWQTLVQFCKGAIDRSEFEDLASRCLKPEHVHLHNSLILGILYNASADVPGPSTSRGRVRVRRTLADGTQVSEDEHDQEPRKKRLRAIVAGLPKKDRTRLKNLEKVGKLGANAAGAAASLGWAGAAADMLEKKRKEEEKRKVVEERRKVRKVKSTIGANDWKRESVQAASQVNAVIGKLSLSTQQAVARAMAAPLCVESKQLPDLEGLRDRMTLMAVEVGMSGGVQSQAAAMVLSALQDHLQNVASSIISKVRSNRPNGIRTAEPQRPASSLPIKSIQEYRCDSITPSPVQNSIELDDASSGSREGSPTRIMRSLHSDNSSRTSTSGLGTSFADSSMLSLASTAATSLAGPPSPSRMETDDSQTQDSSFSQCNGDRDDPHPSKPKLSQHNRLGSNPNEETGTGRLTIADMCLLLELAPHTVVEPMGQGTQERMLVPDWDQDDEAHQVPDQYLAQAAKAAATTKMCDSAEGLPTSIRSQFVIDQSAPLRLLDRRSLAENEGKSGRPTKGGLSMAGSHAFKNRDKQSDETNGILVDSNGRKKEATMASPLANHFQHHPHHHHHRDDIWDVVDPVALFGSLCD